MTSFETLRMHREEDLLWVRLDQPRQANALSPKMLGELTGIYRQNLRGDGVRAVLLSAAGPHFSAGADLKHLEMLRDAGEAENRRHSECLRGLFESVLAQEALTVAMVQGSCVAGGCGLATANDFVVAADDAQFLYSEVRIGFVAALVATYLQLRLRGTDIRELLLNSEYIGAGRAREIGLVNRVVPVTDLEDAGRELTVGILERASSESIARTKRLLLEIVGLSLEEALDRATAANTEARSSADCRRGIASFLETKTAPKWR